MKKNIEELYTKGDSQTGENVYYIDKECTQPYTGWIREIFQGKLSWEFQTKDGEQNGLEKIFHSNGTIEQISEYKNNLQFGVSKEYDTDGNLTYISVIWNNGFLKTLYIEDNKIVNIEINKKIDSLNLPERLQYLINLNNEDLLNYKFKEDNSDNK